LHSVFERDGHIGLGTLWEYYTTYPYLARLRDRSVLEEGVLSTLDTPIDWQRQGFALADGWDGQNYAALVLPTDAAIKPATVDALLLVDPVRAEHQRQREIDTGPSQPGPGTGEPGVQPGGGEPPPPQPPPPPPRPSKTRFFGTATLNPEFYARDFGRITSEVIQHLAAVEGVELEVRLEITAVARDGFDDAKVRTVSENAHTLKFEQSGFEAE
jgi:hypothetical protein